MDRLPGQEPQKILMVLPFRDFSDHEYSVIREVMESSGFDVEVCSSQVGRAKGAGGTWVAVERSLREVLARDFAAVVFVGGFGALEFSGSAGAAKLAVDGSSCCVTGAICVAPSILAAAGLLDMRRATSHSSRTEHLRQCGAVIVDEPVVVSEWIVTASGPAASDLFARKVVELTRARRTRD